jgi:hypothetical protein
MLPSSSGRKTRNWHEAVARMALTLAYFLLGLFFERTARRYIPEDRRTLHNHRCESLKPYRLPHAVSMGFVLFILIFFLFLRLSFFVFCVSFVFYLSLFLLSLYISFCGSFFPLLSYSRTSWSRGNAVDCNQEMLSSNLSRGINYSRVSRDFAQYL